MSDMSGHVVKLNDDEEDEDNDDTGGLLSHDDSDDDFADLRHQNKSRGRNISGGQAKIILGVKIILGSKKKTLV